MTSNLGLIALVKQHSKKEKMLRKKYTGVCSLESAQVVVTITVLPAMDARYARECTRKRIFPRRWTASRQEHWSGLLPPPPMHESEK